MSLGYPPSGRLGMGSDGRGPGGFGSPYSPRLCRPVLGIALKLRIVIIMCLNVMALACLWAA